MKIVAKLIAILLTVVLVSLVTLGVTTTVATMLSFLGFAFLGDKIVLHVKDKRMPKIIEWIDYSCILIANILLIAGLRYHSMACLITSIVFYVLWLICDFINKSATNVN